MTAGTQAAEVVGLGECLVAFQPLSTGPLFASSVFEAHVVGAEANVCVGLARLEHSTAFIGRLGADGLGEAIIRELRKEGVDTSGAIVDNDATTAIQIRERRGYGPSEFLYYRQQSAGSRLSIDDVRRHERLIAGARWLHLSGITPALSPEARQAVHLAADIAAEFETRISFDVNFRSKLWLEEEARQPLLELVARSHLVFAGEEEAVLLVGEEPIETLAERLLAAAHPGATAILKLGESGAMAFSEEDGLQTCPAVHVDQIADVIGAGDAFAAGFLSARLDGLTSAEALARATECAAFAVASYGDIRGLPRRHEIERPAPRGDKVVR
jgi:2-dehydro-3-deoxygluconokinase